MSGEGEAARAREIVEGCQVPASPGELPEECEARWEQELIDRIAAALAAQAARMEGAEAGEAEEIDKRLAAERERDEARAQLNANCLQRDALMLDLAEARAQLAAALAAQAAQLGGQQFLDGVLKSQLVARGADRLADEVAALVRRGIIDARSPAGDALLDYRDPPSTPRADRLAALEAQTRALREALERIARGDEGVFGLRPEFYGHGIVIAKRALGHKRECFWDGATWACVDGCAALTGQLDR